MSKSYDTVIIRFKLEGENISASTFGWPDLREFNDLLVKALRAMPKGPTPSELLPVAISEGSLVQQVRVPRPAYPAVQRFQRGPNRTWTRAMRRSAEPLYGYLRSRDATLGCSVRGPSRQVVVPEGKDWMVAERISAVGEVFRVGGQDGKVDVRFHGETTLKCPAGKELAKALGEHLYQNVVIEGHAQRDAMSGQLVNVQITGFRPSNHVGGGASLADELSEILGDSTKGLDVQALLKATRG